MPFKLFNYLSCFKRYDLLPTKRQKAPLCNGPTAAPSTSGTHFWQSTFSTQTERTVARTQIEIIQKLVSVLGLNL